MEIDAVLSWIIDHIQSNSQISPPEIDTLYQGILSDLQFVSYPAPSVPRHSVHLVYVADPGKEITDSEYRHGCCFTVATDELLQASFDKLTIKSPSAGSFKMPINLENRLHSVMETIKRTAVFHAIPIATEITIVIADLCEKRQTLGLETRVDFVFYLYKIA